MTCLRFCHSLRLAPGIRVNLGLHGAGLSLGPRGLHVGVIRRGMYTSAGIPGNWGVLDLDLGWITHPNSQQTACARDDVNSGRSMMLAVSATNWLPDYLR